MSPLPAEAPPTASFIAVAGNLFGDAYEGDGPCLISGTTFATLVGHYKAR